MNRILFEAGELQDEMVVLTDHRAEHIRRVLRAKVGDELRTGEIDGPLSSAKVQELKEERVVLHITEGAIPGRPDVDLILALPRPKVLNRLLPQIATLGVDRLFLCNASRVERYYFDCHVLEPETLRTRLIEGLTQAGDTRLPKVKVIKQLRHFMEDDCSSLFKGSRKWLLHPGTGRLLHAVSTQPGRHVLAIGPEGGWVEGERNGFHELDFEPVQLGTRILRSDTAAIVSLGMLTCSGDA